MALTGDSIITRKLSVYQEPAFLDLVGLIRGVDRAQCQPPRRQRLPSENYEPYNLGADAHVGDFNDRRYSNDTRGFPSDREIWESVVALARWKGRTLASLELHPITLQHGQGRTVRGRPLLAGGELGAKILGDVADRSKRFGTAIAFEKGVGRVVLK